MKRRLLYIVLVAMSLAGCRQKGDVYLDPNDEINMHYTTYAKQFDIIWRGLNTHYVFWSEDPTDWNAVYATMMPKFQALDEAYQLDGTVADSARFMDLYTEACSTLIDHHMSIVWRDVHTGKQYVIYPGLMEMRTRDYTKGQSYNADSLCTVIDECVSSGMLDGGRWGKMGDQRNFFGMRTLDDGRKIAYLWQSNYQMTNMLNATAGNEDESKYIKNIEGWRKACLEEPNLAGIILDNRCNTGGNVADLQLLFGPYINSPLHYCDGRYKEGPGRYEYSAWEPLYVDTVAQAERRDLAAEKIPYVVLINAWSVSMAEMSAATAKLLPTGHVIGERSFGAHGMLTSPRSIFHDGTFGDPNGLHYVYTSSMQNRMAAEGRLLEGIGITPNTVVLQRDKGFDGVLQAAIDYISR